MSADEALMRRWLANTAAAGVQVTDEDIARLTERGFLSRIRAVEAIIERTAARDVVPDYLDTRMGGAGLKSGERPNG